jgi:hypothetical protein
LAFVCDAVDLSVQENLFGLALPQDRGTGRLSVNPEMIETVRDAIRSDTETLFVHPHQEGLIRPRLTRFNLFGLVLNPETKFHGHPLIDTWLD